MYWQFLLFKKSSFYFLRSFFVVFHRGSQSSIPGQYLWNLLVVKVALGQGWSSKHFWCPCQYRSTWTPYSFIRPSDSYRRHVSFDSAGEWRASKKVRRIGFRIWFNVYFRVTNWLCDVVKCYARTEAAWELVTDARLYCVPTVSYSLFKIIS